MGAGGDSYTSRCLYGRGFPLIIILTLKPPFNGRQPIGSPPGAGRGSVSAMGPAPPAASLEKAGGGLIKTPSQRSPPRCTLIEGLTNCPF